MPYIDKNTKKWVGEFQVGGKPHIELRKRKKGFPTKEAAKEWEEAEREAYLNPPDPNVLTNLKPCVSKYLRFCEKRTQQNTCHYKTAIYVQMFQFWHHDPAIEELTPLHFSDFLDHIYDAKNGATANRYLREINSLLNWCVENRLLSGNPTATLEKYYAEPFKKYVPLQKILIW